MRSDGNIEDPDVPEPDQLMLAHEQWWREGVIPLYGLSVEYDCRRMIGDAHREYFDAHDGRGPQLVGWHGLGLGHGNPTSADDDPWLHVITATSPGPTAEELLLNEKLRQGPNATLSHPMPVRVTIRLENKPVEFVGIEEDDCWVVQAWHAGHLVSVAAIQWPREGLELVRIEDPEPYIVGWSNFLRALRVST